MADTIIRRTFGRGQDKFTFHMIGWTPTRNKKSAQNTAAYYRRLGKLFGYLVENGAKKYYMEGIGRVYYRGGGYGGTVHVPAEWAAMFPKKLRDAVAEELTQHFEVEHDLGNYSNFLPKKYQVVKKAAPKRRTKRSTASILGGVR